MTSLTKDEVVKMAREADDTIRSKPFTAEMLSFLERFATICRAPLVAEVERLKKMSVANIMVRIVPGYDGGGEEIYAKSVEEVNAVMSDLSQRLYDVETDRDDWKARALKAEQAGDRAVPDAEDYDLIDRYLRNNLDDADYGEYLAALDRLVTPQPAAQEPTSAAPVVKQLVEALGGLFSGDVVVWSLGGSARPRAAITAGQKFIKENGK